MSVNVHQCETAADVRARARQTHARILAGRRQAALVVAASAAPEPAVEACAPVLSPVPEPEPAPLLAPQRHQAFPESTRNYAPLPKNRIANIQHVVAKYYRVDMADLLSQRRAAHIVRPRHVAMYLAKTLTFKSMPEIGRRFRGRDHTTVLHAVRNISTMLTTDEALARQIDELKQALR